jgi:hypothetical protein
MKITCTTHVDLSQKDSVKCINHINKAFEELYQFTEKKYNDTHTFGVNFSTLYSTSNDSYLIGLIDKKINSAKTCQNIVYAQKNKNTTTLSNSVREVETRQQKYNELDQTKNMQIQQIQTHLNARKANAHGLTKELIAKAKVDLKSVLFLQNAMQNLFNILTGGSISIPNITKQMTPALVDQIKNYECTHDRNKLKELKIANDACKKESVQDPKKPQIKETVDAFINCASNIIDENLLKYEVNDNIVLLNEVI